MIIKIMQAECFCLFVFKQKDWSFNVHKRFAYTAILVLRPDWYAGRCTDGGLTSHGMCIQTAFVYSRSTDLIDPVSPSGDWEAFQRIGKL